MMTIVREMVIAMLVYVNACIIMNMHSTVHIMDVSTCVSIDSEMNIYNLDIALEVLQF